MGFLKKSVAFGVPPAYSRYRRLRPRGEICSFCVNFPRDLKCQSLSSLTVEIALKRRKQAIKYQCWCGVNFPRDLKCQILSSLALEIAFKRREGFCGCVPKLDKDLTAGVFYIEELHDV